MAHTHRQRNYANEQPGLLGVSGHEVRNGPAPGHLHTHRLERFVLFSKAAFRPGGGRGKPYGPSMAGRPHNKQLLPLEANLIKGRAITSIECLPFARLQITTEPSNPEQESDLPRVRVNFQPGSARCRGLGSFTGKPS